jgi:hypothetical protein
MRPGPASLWHVPRKPAAIAWSGIDHGDKAIATYSVPGYRYTKVQSGGGSHLGPLVTYHGYRYNIGRDTILGEWGD